MSKLSLSKKLKRVLNEDVVYEDNSDHIVESSHLDQPNDVDLFVENETLSSQLHHYRCRCALLEALFSIPLEMHESFVSRLDSFDSFGDVNLFEDHLKQVMGSYFYEG